MIGFLSSSSPADQRPFAAAFRKGLEEVGFVETRSVRMDYRWADGHYDRLPGLAAELVRIPVAVLAASGVTAALAAKASTTAIPIVFHTGGDPVQAGLVASLGKPGGNVTGVVSLNKILVPKQLELLHELTPKANVIAFLVNPNNGVVRFDTSNMREAAQNRGVQLDTAFASLVQQRIRALIVQVDPFFDGQRDELAALATRSRRFRNGGVSRIRRCRRLDQLRKQSNGCLPPRGHLYRPDPQGRKAGAAAGAAVGEGVISWTAEQQGLSGPATPAAQPERPFRNL